MECKDIETALVCHTTAAGVPQTLVAHYEYGLNAAGEVILAATRYTNAAGAPVNTAGGTVVVGACAVAAPDVEWQELCDVTAAGVSTTFMRRTITYFQANGTPVVPNVVANFALDQVTAYTPTGTVRRCPDCSPSAARGLLVAWG